MARTPAWLWFWTVLRLGVAILGTAAIVAQLQRSIERALTATTEAAAHVPTVFANFLSFFTIQANALSAIVLAIAAVFVVVRGRAELEDPKWLAVLLACVSTYMIVTGIVYNALLRGIELPTGSEPIPWSNEVLHVVIPFFLLLDVLCGPKRRGLPWRSAWIIVVYPIVWAAYTLFRGPLIVSPGTGDPYWYPYPFMNPNNFGIGYGGVALYIAGIAAAIVAVALFVIWVGRSRVARRADTEVGDPEYDPTFDADPSGNAATG